MQNPIPLIFKACLIYGLAAISFSRASAQMLSDLSLQPAVVICGNGTTGTVTLSAPAPATGVNVNLSFSSTQWIQAPSFVRVAPGTSTASFPITSSSDSVPANITVTANYNGQTATAKLSLVNTTVASVAFHPAQVTAGSVAKGTVTLIGPAPSDSHIFLVSSETFLAPVSPYVTIPRGATSVDFEVKTGTVASPTVATISANALATAKQSAQLTINLTDKGRKWILNNVMFSDASTASGYFNVDADSKTLYDVSIQTTRGVDKLSLLGTQPQYYLPNPNFGNPTILRSDSSLSKLRIQYSYGDIGQDGLSPKYTVLTLAFSRALTNDGGEIPLAIDPQAQFSKVCDNGLRPCTNPSTDISQEIWAKPVVILGDGFTSPIFYQRVVVQGSVIAAPQANAPQVASSATFNPVPVAPGSLVSIFGSGLSSKAAQADALPLPTTLGGVSVTANGVPMPLLFVSPGQINAQLPVEVTSGTAQLIITQNGRSSLPVTFQVSDAAPGMFVFSSQRAVATNQDYTLNTADNPARAGSLITVYFTGQGAVDNPVPDGAAASATPLSRTLGQTIANIEGIPAAVLFSGATPGLAGVSQVNLIVPDGVDPGDQTLVISVGGRVSNIAVITVK